MNGRAVVAETPDTVLYYKVNGLNGPDFQWTGLITSSTDKHYSLDSEDDFRSGCRNVSHQKQFFSELAFVIPLNSFPIGQERVTCRGSKLTNLGVSEFCSPRLSAGAKETISSHLSILFLSWEVSLG